MSRPVHSLRESALLNRTSRRNRRFLLVVVPLFSVCVLLSCQNAASSSTPSSVAVTGINLSSTAYNLEVGGSTGQLSATVSPSTASQSVTWSSANNGIATVSSTGLITGIAAGTTMITATASDGETLGSCGTAVWQTDGTGYLRYLSSDPVFYGWDFFHTPPTSASVLLIGNPVDVYVKKVSGASDEAFGILFCYQDATDYYKLTIAANGQYHVQKWVAGVSTQLVPWTPTGAILTGYNQANLLSVSQTSAGTILISINGTAMPSVADSSFTGGKVAFFGSDGLTTDSAPESFPGTPEDIRYKMTTPIAYP